MSGAESLQPCAIRVVGSSSDGGTHGITGTSWPCTVDGSCEDEYSEQYGREYGSEGPFVPRTPVGYRSSDTTATTMVSSAAAMDVGVGGTPLLARLRRRLRVRNKYRASALLLRLLLLFTVAATVVVAVVVPWYLAKQAGQSSVKRAIRPLLHNVGTTALTSMERYFMLAPAAVQEANETVTQLRNYVTEHGVPLSEFRNLERDLQRIGSRVSPDFFIRYMYWAGLDGQMACVEFDSSTRSMAIEEVRLEEGVLTNQLYWQLGADGENVGYPTTNYTDMGAYDVFEWLPVYLGSRGWWPQVPYAEVTVDGVHELVMSYMVPVFNSSSNFLGLLGVDIRVSHINDIFREYVQPETGDFHGTAFVTQPDGLVIACSVDENITTGDGQELRPAIDFEDNLMSSVARSVTKRSDDPATAIYVTQETIIVVDGETHGGKHVPCHTVLFNVTTNVFDGLNWTLVVAFPESDFTKHLLLETRSTLFVALGVLLVGVAFLCGAVLFISHRLSLVAVHIHTDTGNDVSLDSGLQQVLKKLKDIACNTDQRTQEQIDSVIELLVYSANSGHLYAPTLNQNNLDAATKQWLVAEFGQHSTTGAESHPAPSQEQGEVGNSCSSASFQTPQGGNTPLLPPSVVYVQNIPQALTCAVGQMGFDQWSFNLFNVASVLPCGGATTTLAACASFVLGDDKDASIMQLPQEKLLHFLDCVENSYNQVPYHTSTHAADVLQAVYWLTQGEAGTFLTPLEVFSLHMAAILHDLDHPGANNNFQINSMSELALLYNDTSVLENHHLCIGFRLLHEHNVLSRLSPANKKLARKMLISLILSTDMALHWQIVGEFKMQFDHGQFDRSNPDHRLMLMRLMLKIADVSNVARPRELMLEWHKHLTEEFLSQGDLEKNMGLPVATFMNRELITEHEQALTQMNFIRFVAAPLFETFSHCVPIPEVMAQLEDNKLFWAKRAEELDELGGDQQLPPDSPSPDSPPIAPLSFRETSTPYHAQLTSRTDGSRTSRSAHSGTSRAMEHEHAHVSPPSLKVAGKNGSGTSGINTSSGGMRPGGLLSRVNSVAHMRVQPT
eukprot:TRINITY_DN3826_c0_g1_i2.p1 TRINITY_DN3826_c0_g1~~TRINITY_DN3826_c0_g1_i2.p1  ORF type:complete len:1067 (-),score=237.12 TRINITY_DN3826_c0_g1_i2:51-3251(-)